MTVRRKLLAPPTIANPKMFIMVEREFLVSAFEESGSMSWPMSLGTTGRAWHNDTDHGIR